MKSSPGVDLHLAFSQHSAECFLRTCQLLRVHDAFLVPTCPQDAPSALSKFSNPPREVEHFPHRHNQDRKAQNPIFHIPPNGGHPQWKFLARLGGQRRRCIAESSPLSGAGRGGLESTRRLISSIVDWWSVSAPGTTQIVFENPQPICALHGSHVEILPQHGHVHKIFAGLQWPTSLTLLSAQTPETP